MIVETEAVVLRTMDYGDTSKIVTLYSKKFGKIKVMAKGVRSQKNKFGSSLEPLTISSVVVYKKEQRDLHLLSKSEIALPLRLIQKDTDRLYTGLALIELINMIMHDEEENEKIFSLIVESLQTIDGATKNAVNVLCAFMLKMFGAFGFGISLDQCIICGKPMADHSGPFALIRLSDGKIICHDCYKEGNTNGVRIENGLLKSLRYLQDTPVMKAPALSFTETMKDDMITTLQSYLQYHVEGVRTLRSVSLLYTARTQQQK